MDAYEATKIVFSRIQSLDPENAAKIMGFLLIQDHGEKEMIRLAFGPESLLQSVVLNARQDLCLFPPSSPSAASPPPQSNPFDLTRQNSPRLPARPSPLAVSSPSSWAQPSPLSRTADEIHAGGGEELFDERHQHGGTGEVVYPEECWSPRAAELFPYGMGWGAAAKSGAQLRGLGSFSDVAGLGTDPIGIGWKPCLYFARGYCKNGSSCRFLHGLAGHAAAAGKMDVVVEQELLLRSKSQRHMTSFPNSPTGPLPLSPSTATGKCLNYLLQQQLLQNESQRVVATAAALMLGREEQHKFMGRPRMERSDFAGMVNPGSRQIYLTFPADSTFQEEDVSNYFSIYGPVQDVRIPYQQKRMFGFVTFLYPETVKLILAMGNPHFVCDSRVLVKPYKEKGKLTDKKQQCDRGDFFGCTTPTGVDARDPYDLQPLGARMLYAGNNRDALLRRKLEEQQELQHAIEFQQRRFMDLQLLDVNRNPPAFTAVAVASPPPPCPITTTATTLEGDKSLMPGPGSAAALSRVDQEETSPKEDSDFKESIAEHNLPDSPFASPTKSAFPSGDSFSLVSEAEAAATAAVSSSSSPALLDSTLLPTTSTGSMASFKSCFFPMPRFSTSPGEVGL